MYDIKTARICKSLSQEQLAKMLGVHQTAVSQWEKGTAQPNAKHLKKLLQVLGCKYEDLCR